MSIRFKLLSGIAVSLGMSLVFFLVFGAISRNAFNKAMVNGPLYEQITQGKDVIADILPPPEYIVEAYLTVYQMVSETDPRQLAEVIEKFRSLRKDYEERHVYWTRFLPEGRLREQLIDKSYQPAMKFFEVVDKEVIPAVQQNDSSKAQLAVRSTLRPLYEQHRAAIEETRSSWPMRISKRLR